MYGKRNRNVFSSDEYNKNKIKKKKNMQINDSGTVLDFFCYMTVLMILLFSSEKSRNIRIGYNLNVMRQSVCLVFNPIMIDNYATLFNCLPVGRSSD